MSGGSDTQPTQTTTTEMSKEQRQLWNMAFPGLREFASNVPQRYQGSQIAGFDPSQTKGQNMALDAAGLQQYLTGNAVQANKFLLGDIWNPKSNPALQGAIDASIRPITQQYQEVVQPGLRDEFAAAGQSFGGSRRGVAEGIAGRGYLNSVGDTSSKLVQDQYANNLNAMVRGLGLVPQTTQAALQPAMTVSGVGDIRQRMQQALLNQNVSNFNFDQYAPFLQSKELLSLLGGLPGGTTTSTANNPPQAPWWQQALGGGMMGAQMGSMFGPMGSVAGGGIGALLPFLG
jgi:hypothetical protein